MSFSESTRASGQSQRNRRHVSKRNGNRQPTPGQLRLIAKLQRELARLVTPPPKTRRGAGQRIDALQVAAGHKPRTLPKRDPERKLTSRQILKVSVARDLAAATARENLADEQAQLKLAAAERRARAIELVRHKTDQASAGA